MVVATSYETLEEGEREKGRERERWLIYENVCCVLYLV